MTLDYRLVDDMVNIQESNMPENLEIAERYRKTLEKVESALQLGGRDWYTYSDGHERHYDRKVIDLVIEQIREVLRGDDNRGAQR